MLLIDERLNLVEIFVEDCMLRQKIHEEHLTALPDFLKLAKKLSLNKANLQVLNHASLVLLNYYILVQCNSTEQCSNISGN